MKLSRAETPRARIVEKADEGLDVGRSQSKVNRCRAARKSKLPSLCTEIHKALKIILKKLFF